MVTDVKRTFDYLLVGFGFSLFVLTGLEASTLTGTVSDAASGAALPARIYILDADGQNRFVESASPDGSALNYREQWVPMPGSRDQHTTISAHPFTVELEPGKYHLEIFRGKEFFPYASEIVVGDAPMTLNVRLHRWIDLSSRGWYSGETHVHRRLFELPNVMLAEDLNIAFPVTFWTTLAYEAPNTDPAPLRRSPSPFGARPDVGKAIMNVDSTHAIVPRNTEYEIFSVGENRHVLGAVFILNHQSRFTGGMPPVRAIAARAHAEGAMLDLDKHSWPWSFMLPPVAKVDLFELCNNSVWQTEFGFSNSSVMPPDYMRIEVVDGGMTERGWLDFGFQSYYALLNCGLKMKPTAGTASGVHPVPLGFGRVYVHLPNGFSADEWFLGLRAGRSFVTTGPMLFVTIDDHLAGNELNLDLSTRASVSIQGEVLSANPISKIELIVNGDVWKGVRPLNNRTKTGAYRTAFAQTLPVDESAWVVARCFSSLPHGRERFAHTGPFYIRVPGEPIRPKREEIAFLTNRMKEEIERNRMILKPDALAEFQEALQFYEGLSPR